MPLTGELEKPLKVWSEVVEQCTLPGPKHSHAAAHMVRYLPLLGKQAVLVVPILQTLLVTPYMDSPWLRIPTLAALWKIRGQAELALDGLIEELGGHYGYQLEVLQHIAEMGPAARPAIAVLKEIAFSDQGVGHGGISSSMIDADEEAQRVARDILLRLEG